MKAFYFILVVLLALLCLNGCKTSKNNEAANKKKNDYYVTVKLQSKAIAQNMLNEDTNQNVYVYLPPSYYDSDKSYPVVYYLHGFGDYAEDIFQVNSRLAMDKTFKDGANEFIIVGVNGTNKTGGSFYANSAVIGNWQDYVVNEVVALVDKNFRTIKESQSRGIFGFSMGGFGAYNIALSHPDVFGALLIMSPGLIADGELSLAMETWKSNSRFKIAYAQAFSPNEKDTVNFGNIPTFSGSDTDNEIVRDWESGFGNINEKLERYLALNKPLKSIKIIYGKNDTYTWIPNGCEFFAKLLDNKKIEYSIERLNNGHSIPGGAMQKYIIPFFNESLDY